MSEKNLFDAIECGDVELLKSLLAAGGDVNATHTDTSDSDRMADYAAMTQEDFSRAMGASDKDIARLNEAMDAQLGEKRNLFEEQFKAMMNMATQFTRASESPKTVLMAAAAKGRADMLALLLDAGAIRYRVFDCTGTLVSEGNGSGLFRVCVPHSGMLMFENE